MATGGNMQQLIEAKQNKDNKDKIYQGMKDLGLYKTDPDTWNHDQVNAYENLINTSPSVKDRYLWETLQQARKRGEALTAQEKLDEFYSMSLEYQKQAAEAAAYQMPYQQPASVANQAYSEAQYDSARRQNMRRGLLSLTRYGSNSSTMSGGLSSKSTTLG